MNTEEFLRQCLEFWTWNGLIAFWGSGVVAEQRVFETLERAPCVSLMVGFGDEAGRFAGESSDDWR
jgi:hypothetical protein